MKNWVGDAKNRIFRKKNTVQVTENKSASGDLNNVYGSIKFLTRPGRTRLVRNQKWTMLTWMYYSVIFIKIRVSTLIFNTCLIMKNSRIFTKFSRNLVQIYKQQRSPLFYRNSSSNFTRLNKCSTIIILKKPCFVNKTHQSCSFLNLQL